MVNNLQHHHFALCQNKYQLDKGVELQFQEDSNNLLDIFHLFLNLWHGFELHLNQYLHLLHSKIQPNIVKKELLFQ